MPEAVFRELVGLGVYPGVGERMLEGRVDALDLEREPAAVARGIGEELLLIAAGGVGARRMALSTVASIRPTALTIRLRISSLAARTSRIF